MKERIIKFEHLKFPEKEWKKLNLKILKKKYIFNLLDKIHKSNMKRQGHNYCPDAVWRDMQERCILFSNKTQILVLKDRYDKMIKVYKTGKVHWPGSYKVKEFNPIMAMFLRDQIPEC